MTEGSKYGNVTSAVAPFFFEIYVQQVTICTKMHGQGNSTKGSV